MAQKKAQEADNWKKRKSDADRHLEPVQQENAHLRKEVGALSEELKEIKELLKANRSHAPVVLDENDEFVQNYGDVAQYVARREAQLRDEILKELRGEVSPLKEKLTFQERLTTDEQNRAREMSHYASVKALHPDIDDFLPNGKYGPALAEWANTQPPMIGRVMGDPMAFAPEDVADVVARFKSAARLSKQTKTPSPADIASKVNSHTNVAPPPVPPDVFEDYFGNKDINSLMGRINRQVFDHADPVKNMELKMKAMEEAEAKWERTLKLRSK